MQGQDTSASLINFCSYSFESVNPKVVFTAAVVLFNHALCFKRDKALLQADYLNAIDKINSVILQNNDQEALMALMLCECRMLYENRGLCEVIVEQKGDAIKKNH